MGTIGSWWRSRHFPVSLLKLKPWLPCRFNRLIRHEKLLIFCIICLRSSPLSLKSNGVFGVVKPFSRSQLHFSQNSIDQPRSSQHRRLSDTNPMNPTYWSLIIYKLAVSPSNVFSFRSLALPHRRRLVTTFFKHRAQASVVIHLRSCTISKHHKVTHLFPELVSNFPISLFRFVRSQFIRSITSLFGNPLLWLSRVRHGSLPQLVQNGNINAGS